ncbi:MAG: CoA transferase, partial [Sulfurifustis sp.]
EWAVFCEKVLQQPALAADARFSSAARRNAARAELRALIVSAFSTLRADELVDRMEDAQIANARMNDMHDLWSHPQLKARGRWREVESPAGPLPALGPPGLPDGVAPRMAPIPAVGQHTDAILAELGYDATRVAQLRAERVI